MEPKNERNVCGEAESLQQTVMASDIKPKNERNGSILYT